MKLPEPPPETKEDALEWFAENLFNKAMTMQEMFDAEIYARILMDKWGIEL